MVSKSKQQENTYNYCGAAPVQPFALSVLSHFVGNNIGRYDEKGGFTLMPVLKYTHQSFFCNLTV